MNDAALPISFHGKRVLLTGGSRGIGKCIKTHFESCGAEVTAPPRAEMDLSDPHSVAAYIEEHTPVEADIVIHAAGLNLLAGISELEPELLERVFQVNFCSAAALIRAAVPYMKQKHAGRIVLLSSLYAMVSRERRIAYSASKNALTGLAKTLTLELAPEGILTNCVAPGYVMTEMTERNLSPAEIAQIEQQIPTGRFQTADEIAALVMFLCSPFNQSISGQVIAADGGFLCR